MTITPLNATAFGRAVSRWKELDAATKAAELSRSPSADALDDARYLAKCEIEVARPVTIEEWLAKLDLLACEYADTGFTMRDFLMLACADLSAIGVRYDPSPEVMGIPSGFVWGPPSSSVAA